MDINKENTKYLASLLSNCGATQDEINDLSFDDEVGFFESNQLADWFVNQINFGWRVWQAAKAQAVPEGFVLVPKEPTDAMLFAASGRDIVAEHYGDENIMWPELRETWKAMLEASQEPAND